LGIDLVARVERLVFADGVVLLVSDQNPDAAADEAATDEDTALTLDVLANDSDPDGDALTLASLSDADSTAAGYQTAQGATLSIVDGQVHYDPTTSTTLQALGTGQSLADSFSYSVDDGFGGTDTATVAVAVSGLDDELILPDHYQGLLEADDQGSGQVTNGPEGTNEPSPVHSDYWAVVFEPGQTLEISVRRADVHYDPAFWLFQGLKQPGDFDGGFASGTIDGGDAGFIEIADDGLPPAIDGGPYQDPFLSFTSAAGGVYTVIVTNRLSGGLGDDGLYEYNIFVDIPAI
jgi:VCBS repeat-containing protein